MTKELDRSYSFVVSEVFIVRNICGELTFQKINNGTQNKWQYTVSTRCLALPFSDNSVSTQ